MKKTFLIISFLLLATIQLTAQVNAKMLQFPDVSKSHISFVYAGDIWVVAKEGGTAQRLSSPNGVEIYPKFSPDGSSIAFQGNYNGNNDVFVIPTFGGIPTRVTNHPSTDRMQDWYSDGESILFSSSRESGRQRFSQLYKINKGGGLPEKLPLPYAEYASVSEDGNWLAFTKRTRLNRTWKRYRGGTAPDIWLFNLKDYSSEKITDNIANNEMPMWHGRDVYFVSDKGANKRFNIWKYNLDDKQSIQLTDFKDYDIHFPSIGPDDLVFEAGGKIYLLSLSSKEYKEVDINVVTDEITLLPQKKKAKKFIQNSSLAYNGNRVLLEARGDIFTLPVKHGFVKNITQTSGAAERYPAWSPDGKMIAYWSDKTGEYQLTVKDLEKNGKEKTLTSFDSGYRYNIYWSPDSKKIAFIDQAMKIKIYDFDSEKIVDVDQGLFMYEGALRNFSVSWSSDSKWLAYSRGLDNRLSAVFIFDTKENKIHKVTSGAYTDYDPCFDPEGKYLYYITSRTFSPVYSSFDNTFIYPNAATIAAVPLKKDTPSPIAPRNDEVKAKDDKKDKDEKKKEDKDDDSDDEKKEEIKSVEIDFDGFEQRLVMLSPKAGRYSNLQAIKEKVIYHKLPNTGSADEEKPVIYYDLKEREEKTIIKHADGFEISADGKKMLVATFKGSPSFSVIDIKEDQKMKDMLPLDQMEMTVDPKVEWKQLFTDAWRLERDYFYDPNMHGVDWNSMKEHYGKLLDDAVTRWDVNYVIGELIGEINTSHSYRYGGDTEKGLRENTGLLGIDWELNDGAFRIKKIISGASWDSEVRSPLDQSGLEVKKGDYILAVNGIPLDISKEPYAAFQGLADKTVQLTVNDKPELDGAKEILVKTLKSESRLRHLAWIEGNRKRVSDASKGKIGYVYVRSTGTDGQSELIRQFIAQIDKDGLIIDERFNSGGQIPDRFVEMLDRKPLAYWAVRDGKNWQWPPVAHFGPKVMLINGWSGSGGDAFPDYFRKRGLGPLIGTRTWGGLIGYTGNPGLIDGGGVTVPTFRMYDPDGKWFKEGHGVDPDIEVDDNPTEMAKGKDPQLEAAISETLRLIKENPPVKPKQPAYEIR
jgi:tricorn protease